MRAAQKHSAGHRSKDKSKFDELTENCFETKNEDGEHLQRPEFVLCPFLQSSYDVSGQLLLVIADRSSSNYQNRSPSNRLQSESMNSSTDLTRGLVQKNSSLYEKMSSNNQEAADLSISPWCSRDYLDEIRRPSVSKTYLSSNAKHRLKNNALETTIARNRSNQTTTTSDNKKRWEYLWTGRRPTTDVVAYKFQHYWDIRQYMEQYRQDHVHRGTSSPETKNEEPFHTSTLSICSIGAPLEQPLQDPVRQFLTQRLPYNRQPTELDQQRKRGAKSGVAFLGFRGHLYEENSTSSMKEDTVGKEDGVADERCISGCGVLHPNSRGVLNCVAATVVISGISLPWCSLRVASRRDSAGTPAATRKNISDSDSSKERSPRVAVLPAARTARYVLPTASASYSYSVS